MQKHYSGMVLNYRENLFKDLLIMNLTVQKITAGAKVVGIYDQYPEDYRSVHAIFLTASNGVLAQELRAILF